MANNPYYVEPANILPGVQALTQGLQRRSEFEKELAEKKTRQDILTRGADLVMGGTPAQIAEFNIKNPEYREFLNSALDDKQKGEAKLYANAAKQWLVTDSPSFANMSTVAKTLIDNGFDASDVIETMSRYEKDPESATAELKADAERMLAMYDPDAWKQYSEAKAPKGGQETANIKDYMFYMDLKQKDPAQASEFARQIGITESNMPTVKPTTAMQNFEAWSAMPEGPEKEAFGKLLNINPREKAGDIEARMVAIDESLDKMSGAQQTIDLIDKIKDTEGYLNALTGVRGATPFSVPGGTGRDATVVFDQLKGTLTLANMDKMKGVLSDADIKMLKQAAGGIEPGMSRGAMVDALNRIRKTMEKAVNKSKRVIARQGVDQNAVVDLLGTVHETQLPPGVTEEDVQHTMQQRNMSREEVLSRLGAR